MKYLQKRQKFNGALNSLDRLAILHNTRPALAALKVCSNRRKEIEDYVADHGIMPAENLPELTVQATMLHEGKVIDKMSKGVPNYVEAENAVFQDESDLQDADADASNFLEGGLLASVLSAGKAGIEAVNKKRAEKGSKPFFSGKFWVNLKEKVGDKVKLDVNKNTVTVRVDVPEKKKDANAPVSELKTGIDAFKARIISDQQHAYIKEHAFEIALIAVVLTAYIIYLHKKK